MRRLTVLLVLLLMPLTAWAAEEYASHFYDAGKPHALAYAPAEEPDWVPGMLKQGLPYGVIRQHVLFRWKGEPAWLAVTITDGRKSKVSLFRITGPGKSNQELFLSATNLAIIEPSGSDFFKDGAPILALKHDQARFPNKFGVIILHLADTVTEVTAPGYPLIGISPDGAFAVASYTPDDDDDDERCYPCLTTILVGLQWDGHSLKEACKDTPQLYDDPNLEKRLRTRMQDNDEVDALRADIEWALLKLQKGNFAEAAKLYRDAKRRHLKNARGRPKISTWLDKAILSPSRHKACPISEKNPKEQSLFFRDNATIMTFLPPLFHPQEP